MTDETIIDQGERVQLEVNSAMAGKSRLLSGEPSAPLTKSSSRGCRAPEAGTYNTSDNPALANWRRAVASDSDGCPPCPYLPDGAGGRAPLRGAEDALPPGCARCRAPEHRSVGSEDWLGTAAVGTQPGCSASLLV